VKVRYILEVDNLPEDVNRDELARVILARLNMHRVGESPTTFHGITIAEVVDDEQLRL
jgi:hypothetical protein